MISNQANIQLWLEIVQECLEVCMDENLKERLFLTGTYKTKIKIWQYLMAFPKFLR